MKLFEINAEIEKLFDEETGEIFDIEALEKLEIERDKKLASLIALYKNLSAEAKALADAKKELEKRRKAKENSAERILKYIDSQQKGIPFECVEGRLSYRASKTTEMIDEAAFMEWDGRWDYGHSEFVSSKEEIANAIKAGKEVPGWSIVDHMNPGIK